MRTPGDCEQEIDALKRERDELLEIVKVDDGARKAAAEMRAIIRRLACNEKGIPCNNLCVPAEKLAHVLSSDAGKDFVPKAELDRAKERVGELERLVSLLGKRVLQCDPPNDHACAECFPHGDLVKPYFRCAYHTAKALERKV